MSRLFFILLLSTLGGSFIIHYLKNFLLKERLKFRPDWDGLLERLCITSLLIALPAYWLLIPLVILIKAVFRIYLLGFLTGIGQTREPGAASQKVLYKAELASDLILSPAFAILVGVLLK